MCEVDVGAKPISSGNTSLLIRDYSESNPRLARRTRIIKAKPGARLECFAETPLGSLRHRKRRDSTSGPEDLRCRGRSPATCLNKSFQDSQRSDQKFVLLCTPLPRRHHQGGMQKRLSARSSSFVESVGSGRRSDSELSMCGRYRRTTAQEELARRYHIPIPPQRDLPISWNIAPAQDVLAIRLHPKTRQRTLDTLRWSLLRTGPKIQKSRTRPSTLGSRPLTRPPYTDRHSGNGAASYPLMAFRMEEGSRRKDSVLDRNEGRFCIRICWVMGRLERSRERPVTLAAREPADLPKQQISLDQIGQL
jgi:hypothetical protein